MRYVSLSYNYPEGDKKVELHITRLIIAAGGEISFEELVEKFIDRFHFSPIFGFIEEPLKTAKFKLDVKSQKVSLTP